MIIKRIDLFRFFSVKLFDKFWAPKLPISTSYYKAGSKNFVGSSNFTPVLHHRHRLGHGGGELQQGP